MKTLFAILILGCALAAGPAVAGSFGSGFHIQDQRGFSHSNGQGKRFAREDRAPRQHYTPPAPPPKSAPARLSEDERRQLHRDLDKANRELYRGRRDR